MTKSKQIVLARVRENIDWVKTIKIPHILYTFEDMHNEYYIENIGSEDGFYLQHILKNYNNLADITIFTQANPFDHCKSFIGKLLTIEQTMDGGTGYLALSDLYGKFSKGGAPHHPLNDLPLEHVFKRLFGEEIKCPEEFETGLNGMFAVYKENILMRPPEFYSKVLEIRRERPDRYNHIGCCIERLWHIIFQKNVFGF